MSDTNQKSAGVAYLLWFFLGCFGAHRFYFGRKGSGFGMAGLFIGSTILSAIAIGLIGYPILFIWWIIDAFKINKWINEGSGGQPIEATISESDSESKSEETSEAA